MRNRYTVRHNPHGTPDAEGLIISYHRTAKAARAAAKRAAQHHFWAYAHDDAACARLYQEPCPECAAQHAYDHMAGCRSGPILHGVLSALSADLGRLLS